MLRLQNKYRTFPRAYDLSQVEKYLRALHQCPIPLIEIEKRKLVSSVENGKISQTLADEILTWKKEHGIASADETEYRFLLRDLTLLNDREFDAAVDPILPLGGDGPQLSSFLKSSRFKMHYLTKLGETLFQQLESERGVYEEKLFWLILRNKYYLPLIQEIIANPKSYQSKDLREIVVAEDSVSKNCVLQWLRFFGIVNSVKDHQAKYGRGTVTRNRLQSVKLARYLLSSVVFEINFSFQKSVDYYVTEIGSSLSETFSLNPTAVSFVCAIDLIFRAADKSTVRGFKSGRNDVCLPSHSDISIIRILKEIPSDIAKFGNSADVLKITPYSSV